MGNELGNVMGNEQEILKQVEKVKKQTENAVLAEARKIRAEREKQRIEARLDKYRGSPLPRAIPFNEAKDLRECKRASDGEVKFNVVYADPPWKLEFSGSYNRKVENHYPTMELSEICALPVSEIVSDDALLFLWATTTKLEEALIVMNAWGFKYRSSAVWVKPEIGMGYYFRMQHEFLLVGKRGNLPVPQPANRPRSVHTESRGAHSAKPHAYYEYIEQMYPGVPKIELFARNTRDGWVSWGNQAPTESRCV